MQVASRCSILSTTLYRMKVNTNSLLSLLTMVLYAQPVTSVWDGVYAQAQADRGKALYGQHCASCHGATLDGSGAVPPLAGADFKGNWNGQTADALFEKIQTSMPADKPGT